MSDAIKKENGGAQPEAVSGDALIFTIGVLSGLLPILLYVCVEWFFPWDTQQPSMSDYVYTTAAPIFYGIVTTLGVVLFFYRGYPQNDGPIPISDNNMATMAGLGAITLVIFPTDHCLAQTGQVINWLRNDYATNIHFIAAGLAYTPMALFFLFYFTQTGGVPNNQLSTNKRVRNAIYRICGLTVIGGILFIISANFYFSRQGAALCDFAGRPGYVYWAELLMQGAIAVAWCTKYAGRRFMHS